MPLCGGGEKVRPYLFSGRKKMDNFLGNGIINTSLEKGKTNGTLGWLGRGGTVDWLHASQASVAPVPRFEVIHSENGSPRVLAAFPVPSEESGTAMYVAGESGTVSVKFGPAQECAGP
jgi:hypothetical protein